LRDPLGHLTEHPPIVDFLECLAIHVFAGALADEEDHRCGILERGVNADGCVRCAGSARDERDTWSAGQFADGFGHVGGGGFVAADDCFDAAGFVVEGIEDGEEAFAGYAEHTLDTVG
jgi:hypothetical protein